MDKKYPESPNKPTSSLKEQPRTAAPAGEVRYATTEMMEKAVAEVMKIHGEALRKLAQ